MRISPTTLVRGKGPIKRSLIWKNSYSEESIYHVLEVRNNLVFGNLLNKFGFKLIVESDKFVLTKMDNFVEKGYSIEDMFKLDINNKVNA